MSTLSDLVLAQGRSSQADVAWLHLLVGDLQLLADLAFADIVLWVPSGDDDFVAVAHSRPSSAATLFYRDFVGQQIKPQWRDLVTRAFETSAIVDSSAPDWYEEMPTRVRAVPVMRRLSSTGTELAPEPVAVITRHTNLGATRSLVIHPASTSPTSARRRVRDAAPLERRTGSSASTSTASPPSPAQTPSRRSTAWDSTTSSRASPWPRSARGS